jgi:glutamate formiminotransferase
MLVQCVPNFSEGRDSAVIEELAASMRGRRGAALVDYSADPEHHRSVFTLVGTPEPVLAAVLDAARVALARVDLTRHQGAHPRIGALDVLPFVPLADCPSAVCVDLALRAGRAIGDLGIPVFLYEDAATRPGRRNLADVRRGGFEQLAAGPLTGERAPDFGPPAVHPTAGATAVGARGPLTAFNVLLDSADLDLGRDLARRIRGAAGGLPGVKALAILVGGRVQVSLNLTRPDLTPPHAALEWLRREAAARGAAVAESELIGTLRLEELLAAAREYLGLGELRRGQVLDLWAAALAPATVLGSDEDAEG